MKADFCVSSNVFRSDEEQRKHMIFISLPPSDDKFLFVSRRNENTNRDNSTFNISDYTNFSYVSLNRWQADDRAGNRLCGRRRRPAPSMEGARLSGGGLPPWKAQGGGAPGDGGRREGEEGEEEEEGGRIITIKE